MSLSCFVVAYVYRMLPCITNPTCHTLLSFTRSVTIVDHGHTSAVALDYFISLVISEEPEPEQPPEGCNTVLPCHHCYLSDASGAPSTTWLRCTDTKWFKEGEGECTQEECPDDEPEPEPDETTTTTTKPPGGSTTDSSCVCLAPQVGVWRSIFRETRSTASS